MMSGPPENKFRRGWALPVGSFGAAHYFRRSDLGPAVALCGRARVEAGRLLGVGSWRRCRICEEKAP